MDEFPDSEDIENSAQEESCEASLQPPSQDRGPAPLPTSLCDPEEILLPDEFLSPIPKSRAPAPENQAPLPYPIPSAPQAANCADQGFNGGAPSEVELARGVIQELFFFNDVPGFNLEDLYRLGRREDLMQVLDTALAALETGPDEDAAIAAATAIN